tara:strand:- start:4767 stop:6017 length:1251 start_codon:yes stop_codon:yes gene_type:complete
MSDLYSYLTNNRDYGTSKPKPVKRGKKLKQRRLKFGTRQGKYTPKQQRNYNNKEDKLDKLLTLLISRTNAPAPEADLKRQQQIASDYTIAQTIQADEVETQSKGKSIDKMNDEPLQRTETDKQMMSGRMQEYNTDYEQLEQGYKSLIATMNEDIGEDSIIRTEALDEIIANKENLSAKRNELRKELLDDIKQNPSDIGEWKAFIETSEVQTSNLLELDNTASQILFDNTRLAFNKKEELSAKQLKSIEENQQLTQDLLTQSQNEIVKEKQMKAQLEQALEAAQEEKERGDYGEDQVREILNKKLKQEKEDFAKGENVMKQYFAGELKSSTTAVKEARQLTGVSDYWTKITGGPNPMVQTAPERQRKMEKYLKERKELLEQELDIPTYEKFKSAMPQGFSPNPKPSGSVDFTSSDDD